MNSHTSAQLRSMLIDGATPIRLMEHIASSCPSEHSLQFDVDHYFRDAFGVKHVGGVFARKEFPTDYQCWTYNIRLLPEIVRRVSEWNKGDLSGTWLDGVTIEAEEEIHKTIQKNIPSHFESSWSTMSDEEKSFVVSRSVNAGYYWMVMKMLSALLERLQEKICTLERQLLENG